jgi:hypothetical protein
MKNSDVYAVQLPDGKSGIHCETVDAMRFALRQAVKTDFKNGVTIGNLHDYDTSKDLSVAQENGFIYMRAEYGFPGKMRVTTFRLPAAAVKAYQASKAAADPEPETETETEVKLPGDWRFATPAEEAAQAERASR